MKRLLERFYWFLAFRLPVRLVGLCVVRVVAAASTGPYSRTIVPDLTATEALKRWDRINGIPGSGADQYYDSNRKAG